MLSPRQIAFAQAYARNKGPVASAREAGYTGTDGVLAAQASRLLRKAKIQQLLLEHQAKAAALCNIDAATILLELLRIARSDISEAFDKDGRMLPINEIPENCRRAIAGVEIETLYEGHGSDKRAIGTTTKIKLWDKVKALELIAKHLNLLIEKAKPKEDAQPSALLVFDDAPPLVS